MPFELEALVGHLYISGGKVIKTTPPGALVEVAPRRAARGREADTFFALVLPSGPPAPVTFYEQMSLMAAERYFSNGGSITSALREVFNTLNGNLYEHNQSGRQQYEANMVLAVLRDEELYVARAGAAAAVIRHSGATLTYPEDLTDDEAMYKPPLGVQPIPEVDMKKFDVDSGSRMVLADASMAEILPEHLTQALVASDLETVLDDLKVLITLQTQMMAIEFVPPDEPAPVVAAAGQSSKAISAELAAARAQAQAKVERRKSIAEGRQKEPASEKARNAGAQVIGRMAIYIGELLRTIGDLLARLMGQRDEDDRPRFSRAALTTMAIALPLTLAVVVVLSWVGNVGTTDFENCVADATSAADVARNIPSNQRQSLLTAWQGVQTITQRCQTLNDDDPVINTLSSDAQEAIDALSFIERRNATLVGQPLPDANISRLILQGFDLYALDRQNSLVYRIPLGTTGMGADSRPQVLQFMRRGATIDNQTIGDIFDIAFGGNRLLALDENGVLIRCQPQFLSNCDAQQLPDTNDFWVTPIAFQYWQDRLYVLDRGASQIWRYEQSGGLFASRPTEYFTGEVRPQLDSVVDFAISETGITSGRVYTLLSGGIMMTYFGGEREQFAFAGFPEGQELDRTTVQGMYLNDSPIDTAFYIVSQPLRTIYETSIAGSHNFTYRIYDDERFARLSDVAVEPSLGVIYAASGDRIYAIQRDAE